MAKVRDQRHRAVVIHFCKNYHKNETGGVVFVRVC